MVARIPFRDSAFRLVALAISVFFLGASSYADEVNTGFFRVNDWDGPGIRVFFAEPDSSVDSAPIVLVMHGVNRNADDYRDNWVDIVAERGFAVYAPEFRKRAFPGAAGYNLGERKKNGVGAFGAIRPLIEAIRERRDDAGPIVMFGHSAGAQFVHRWLLLQNDAEIDLLIAANAGWYTMPDPGTDWPYGLKGAPFDDVDLDTPLAAPLLVLLGERDIDPNANYLRKTPEAEAQGAHRFARGKAFFMSGREAAMARDIEFGWRLGVVRGAGHDNRAMAVGAAVIIDERFTRDGNAD